MRQVTCFFEQNVIFEQRVRVRVRPVGGAAEFLVDVFQHGVKEGSHAQLQRQTSHQPTETEKQRVSLLQLEHWQFNSDSERYDSINHD